MNETEKEKKIGEKEKGEVEEGRVVKSKKKRIDRAHTIKVTSNTSFRFESQ